MQRKVEFPLSPYRRGAKRTDNLVDVTKLGVDGARDHALLALALCA
jgi:hypothetical protein